MNKRPLYLDAHNDAPVLNHFGEVGAIIGVLIQGLVEEDDPADALVNALVGCEEELAIQTAVLLCVLDTDGVQTLSHANCKEECSCSGYRPTVVTVILSVTPTDLWIHLQPGCPSRELRCAERCPAAPSSARA